MVAASFLTGLSVAGEASPPVREFLPVGIAVPAFLGGYYLWLRRECTRRRQMIARAEEVPCSVENTDVVVRGKFSKGPPQYVPVVEFTYEHDGTERRSQNGYPGRASGRTRSLNPAQASAETFADAERAYYDPETDQAFLVDDPRCGMAGQLMKSLVLALVGAFLSVLFGAMIAV